MQQDLWVAYFNDEVSPQKELTSSDWRSSGDGLIIDLNQGSDNNIHDP